MLKQNQKHWGPKGQGNKQEMGDIKKKGQGRDKTEVEGGRLQKGGGGGRSGKRKGVGTEGQGWQGNGSCRSSLPGHIGVGRGCSTPS